MSTDKIVISEGVIAPNLTPFEDDLSIAKDLYLENVHRLIDDGCAALAPFGTTGEALSVSTADIQRAAKRVFGTDKRVVLTYLPKKGS